MAAANINMLLNVQTSTANLAQVNKSIQRGVGTVELTFADKGLGKAKAQIQSVGDATKKASKDAKTFADAIALKGTSYAAYGVASQAILKLTGAISNATRESIRLEVELAKIAQTTNRSVASIKANTDAVLSISRNFGVASNKVAELIRLLTQTGLSFREAAKGAEVLARTSLLASFDNLRDTTEGLIALMNSFELSTKDAASGLEVINVLAKRFAVESGDIVEAIKRSGGAFKAAGGNLEELASLFTAVRSTSRESAETIATAFRTIFGRLQRPKTIEFFKELNIELADAEGNFIGPKNAIFAISDGLEKLGIQAGSIRFAEVAEQIGGIRQLSKVVPLLTQTAKARRALQVANEAEAESDKDVAKAKQTLGFQLAELTQNFRSLISEVMESSTFKAVAQVFLTIANAAVDIGRALKPLLPLFAVFGTVKLSQGLSSIIKFVSGGGLKEVKEAGSGSGSLSGVLGFNRGGVVPGSGNSDTVPAMLTPGEFVIRKSAVQAFGAGNLGRINKYASGGVVEASRAYAEIQDRILNLPIGLTTGKAFNRGDKFVADIREEEITVPKGNRAQTDPTEFEKYALAQVNATKKKLKKNDYLDGIGPEGQLYEAKSGGWRKSRVLGKLAAHYLSRGERRVPSRTTSSDDDINLGGVTVLTRKNLNRGGAISGTDTVPAMLTPGEFVVNQKSAKAFGYANLGRINKYAKGGRVQRFQNGGEVPDGVPFSIPTGGTNLFDEPVQAFGDALERAGATTDQVNAGMLVFSQKLTEGATTLEALKAGALEAGFAASTVAEAQEKHMKSMAEAFGRTGQTAPEGLTAGKELIQLDKFIQDATQALESNAQEVEALEAELSTLAKGTVDHAKKEKELADLLSRRKKVESAIQGAESEKTRIKKESGVKEEVEEEGSSISGVLKGLIPSATALSAGLVGANSALESFGVELVSNKEAFSAGAGQAAAIDQYSKAIGDNAAKLGPQLEGWGKSLEARGGKLGKFGSSLGRAGKFLTKFGPKIVKFGNVLGTVALAGTAAEALFAKNFASIAKQQAELGDVAGAGAAAQKAYAQEINRSIPIIGGFLNALGVDLTSLFGGGEVSNLVKGTAELTAATNKLERTDSKLAAELAHELKDALKTGDFSKVSEIAGQRAAGLQDIEKRALDQVKAGTAALDFFWASNRKKGVAAIEASNKAIDQIISKTQAQFNDLQPLLQQLAQNSANAGASLQSFINATKQIQGLQALTGGAIGEETRQKLQEDRDILQAEADKIVANLREGKRSQVQGQGDQLEVQNINKQIDLLDTKLQNNRIAESLKISADAVAKEQRIRNAAFKESIASLRAFDKELRGFTAKNKELDFLDDQAEFAKTGELNTGVALGQLGLRGVASAQNISEVVDTDRENDFIAAAGIVGPETQTAAIKAVELTKSVNNFLDNATLPEMKAGDDNYLQAAEDLVDEIIPAGILGPAQTKLLNEEVAKAIKNNNLEELKKALENAGGEEAKRAFEAVQSGVNLVAEFAVKVQGRELEFYKMQDDLNKKRFALVRKRAALEISTQEETIAALEQIGLKSKDSIAQRAALQRQEIKGIKKRNVEEAAKAKESIEDLQKRRKAITGEGPVAVGRRAALDKEIRNRQDSLLTVGPKEQLTEAGIDAEIAARKKGISIMIEEEKARRENTKALQEARGALAEELAFGTDEARASLLDDANVAATALSRGSMSGFTGEQRQQTERFLDRFTGLGGDLGRQAREAKGRLGAQELFEQGVISADMIDQVAKDIAGEDEPINQKVADGIEAGFRRIAALEAAKLGGEEAKIKREEEIQKRFGESVDIFAKAVKEEYEEKVGKKSTIQAERAVFDRGTEAAKQRKAESDERVKKFEGDLKKAEQEAAATKDLQADAERLIEDQMQRIQAFEMRKAGKKFTRLDIDFEGSLSKDPRSEQRKQIDAAIAKIKASAEEDRYYLKRMQGISEDQEVTDKELIESGTRDNNRRAKSLRYSSQALKFLEDFRRRQEEGFTAEGAQAARSKLEAEQARGRGFQARVDERFVPPAVSPRTAGTIPMRASFRQTATGSEVKPPPSPEIPAKRQQDLQRRAADTEKRTQQQQQQQQQQIQVRGEHTVNVQGITLTNNVDSNKPVAKALRVTADRFESATTVQEQADAIRQGATVAEEYEVDVFAEENKNFSDYQS